jgi:hypothetical protein
VEEGELYIDGLEMGIFDYELSMYNSLGAEVHYMEQHCLNGDRLHSLKIQLPETPPGLYLLQITSGEISATRKIIIR